MAIRQAIHDWFIRVTDPLFPPTEEDEYVSVGLRKSTWLNAIPVLSLMIWVLAILLYTIMRPDQP